MAEKQERRGLGRGLSALLADVETDQTSSVDRTGRDADLVPIDRVHPNPDQPRRTFNEQDMADLTASIKDRGIIQPLIVRPDPSKKNGLQIVAGERRWRAAQRAQLHEIPVLIRDFSDSEVLEIAIIENIQRSDLNATEEALGYRQLMDRFGHTQEQLAEVLGKSRSHIANLLRILNLPDAVLDMVRDGTISAGHARALVPVSNPLELARQIARKGLSVRQAEALTKRPDRPAKSEQSKAPQKDADTMALEGDLSAQLRTRVTLHQAAQGEGGEIRIRYASFEQLDELLQHLAQ